MANTIQLAMNPNIAKVILCCPSVEVVSSRSRSNTLPIFLPLIAGKFLPRHFTFPHWTPKHNHNSFIWTRQIDALTGETQNRQWLAIHEESASVVEITATHARALLGKNEDEFVQRGEAVQFGCEKHPNVGYIAQLWERRDEWDFPSEFHEHEEDLYQCCTCHLWQKQKDFSSSEQCNTCLIRDSCLALSQKVKAQDRVNDYSVANGVAYNGGRSLSLESLQQIKNILREQQKREVWSEAEKWMGRQAKEKKRQMALPQPCVSCVRYQIQSNFGTDEYGRPETRCKDCLFIHSCKKKLARARQ